MNMQKLQLIIKWLMPYWVPLRHANECININGICIHLELSEQKYSWWKRVNVHMRTCIHYLPGCPVIKV